MNAFDYWFEYIQRNGEYSEYPSDFRIPLYFQWEIWTKNFSYSARILNSSDEKYRVIFVVSLRHALSSLFLESGFDILNPLLRELKKPIL